MLLKLLEALCLLCSVIVCFFPAIMHLAMFIDIFNLNLFESEKNIWQILVTGVVSMISYGSQVIRLFQILCNKTSVPITIGIITAWLFYFMILVYSLFEYALKFTFTELMVYIIPVIATGISLRSIYAQRKRQASPGNN